MLRGRGGVAGHRGRARRSSSIGGASRRPSATSPTTRSTAEIARFDAALAASDEQLERVKRKLQRARGRGPLPHHRGAPADPARRAPGRADAAAHPRGEDQRRVGAAQAPSRRSRRVFDAIEEDYFRERRSDVDFVGDRILRNLLGRRRRRRRCRRRARSIVAHDLSPADTAHLHRAACAAFVTDVGGKTSHSAILARAFEIPAVVGLENVTEHVGNGDLLIVDGLRGEVIIRPDAGAGRGVSAARRGATSVRARAPDATATCRRRRTDGARVRLYANVELTEEVPTALEHGAEGIGLYRTEFLFLDRTRSAERGGALHARARRARAAASVPGDVPHVRSRRRQGGAVRRRSADEANPALGLRSIRLCLQASASCSRRSCAACCARRCTGACASCSR